MKEDVIKETKCKDKECNETCSCHCEESEIKEKKKDKKEKYQKEIEELTTKIKDLEDKVRLSQADLINYRKRKDEETSNLLKYANQDLIMEIIPILDNFERAIRLDDENLEDELSKFLSGFKMMYAHLRDTLEKFGVEEIKAQDMEFDPNLHEALMVDCVEDKQDNIVLEVLLKGYKLKDRVIRPSAVRVNKIDMKNQNEIKEEN